jgi:hypothetical protein
VLTPRSVWLLIGENSRPEPLERCRIGARPAQTEELHIAIFSCDRGGCHEPLPGLADPRIHFGGARRRPISFERPDAEGGTRDRTFFGRRPLPDAVYDVPGSITSLRGGDVRRDHVGDRARRHLFGRHRDQRRCQNLGYADVHPFEQ